MKTSDFDKQDDKGGELASNLKLIFAYYCKLNNQKSKHKMFEDFNEKAEMMTLHQFMTFCKNFQITAKQHKRTDNNILSQFLESKRNKKQPQDNGSLKKNDLQKITKQISNDLLPQLEDTNVESLKKEVLKDPNEFLQPPNKKINIESQAQQSLKLPTVYLTQRKIAQIFKRYASQQGEINFQFFIAVLKSMAQQIYEKQTNQITQVKQQSQKMSIKSEKQQISITQTEPIINDSFVHLLAFLNLDTKFHVIETFAKINQLHGTMEHLALMRSPIKKLNLKNDPLGKYARKDQDNKENTSKSRILYLDKTDKRLQKSDKLPRVVKQNIKKELLNYAKNDVKSITKEQLSVFMLANRSQIDHLNKSYLKSGGIFTSEDHTKRDVRMDSLEANTLKNYSGINQKSNKKYSERHKDKLIGDINHKQIGKLIDISSLYDDEIFNKYVEINYKNDKK